MDTNARAVKIAVEVFGISERQAVLTGITYKRAVKVQRAKTGLNTKGHPDDVCVEIRDLVGRYPAQADLLKDGC